MDREQLRAVIARAEAGESLADLRRQDAVHYDVQLQRRLALPFAPFLFGMVGVPLGARRARPGRATGVLVCAGLVLCYYALMTLGQLAAIERLLPVPVGLWLPNAAFAGAAGLLLHRATRRGPPLATFRLCDDSQSGSYSDVDDPTFE